MDAHPDPARPSLTPWISLVAIGASVIVIALAPGVAKLPSFAVAAALIAAGLFGIARIASGGALPQAEPQVFARTIRTWTIITAAGAASMVVGLLALDLLVLAGLALVLVGAAGAIVTAVRHRHAPH